MPTVVVVSVVILIGMLGLLTLWEQENLLFARSGRNWAHVPRDWDAPCRINFFNLRTGRAFSAGHIDPEPMVRDLLG